MSAALLNNSGPAVGIFGSDGGGSIDTARAAAIAVGAALGKERVAIITGACSGLPYVTASTAHAAGRPVWGFSPEFDLEAQRAWTPTDDLNIYERLIFVPKDFPCADSAAARKKYRNVISTASCDAGIIIAGRWGTLNEVTNLIDQGKVVGILTGTGGIADELEHLNSLFSKPGAGPLIFDASPERLVERVLQKITEIDQSKG